MKKKRRRRILWLFALFLFSLSCALRELYKLDSPRNSACALLRSFSKTTRFFLSFFFLIFLLSLITQSNLLLSITKLSPCEPIHEPIDVYSEWIDQCVTLNDPDAQEPANPSSGSVPRDREAVRPTAVRRAADEDDKDDDDDLLKDVGYISASFFRFIWICSAISRSILLLHF